MTDNYVSSYPYADTFLEKNNIKDISTIILSDEFNNNLIECMEWQDLPELKHDKIKLGGRL